VEINQNFEGMSVWGQEIACTRTTARVRGKGDAGDLNWWCVSHEGAVGGDEQQTVMG